MKALGLSFFGFRELFCGPGRSIVRSIMAHKLCIAVAGLALLSAMGASDASAQTISGTYVASSPTGAFMLVVVEANGGQLTGRYEHVELRPSGKMEDSNKALTGVINNGTVVATLKEDDFLSQPVTVSGSFDGQALHLTGGGGALILNLFKADESAFHSQVAKLTEQANQIHQAQAEADQQKKAAQAKADQADQIAKALVGLRDLSKRLADFGAFADKNFSRFDRVEQKYRTITADMRRGLTKQKAIIGEDGYDARTNISIWIENAQSAASNLHDSVETAHADFTRQTKSILADTARYDQICVPIANAKIGNDPDITTALVWKAACATFQKGEAAFYARVNSIEGSFQHIAIVWGQESQAQKEIIQASNAVR